MCIRDRLYIGDYIAFLALAALVFLTLPFTRMFVKLSHHCQRGTGNTTCLLYTSEPFVQNLRQLNKDAADAFGNQTIDFVSYEKQIADSYNSCLLYTSRCV